MSRRGGWSAWLLSFIAATICVGAAAAEPTPTALASRGGALWLRPNLDLLAQMELRRAPGGKAATPWEIALLPQRSLEVELGDGAPTRVRAGELNAPGLRLRRGDGEVTPPLSLIADPEVRMGWLFVDAAGEVWLRITHGMRSPDRQRDGLRLITADLRVGPALAAWSGVAAEDRLLANASLHLPLDARLADGSASSAAPKSCAVPNWPGAAGFVADVELLNLIDVGGVGGVDVLRCRTGGVAGCDGPGGEDGEVVFVPSALLRNRPLADAADLPWHTKFSGIFPPYNNDQHPYLVWNFYRLDANGRIEQLGRSGLKHAFATANEFCQDATCPPNGQVLGRACQDIYNAGSNDVGFLLSSRSEVIPARGIWGRCGSVFDDVDNNPGDALTGCDGVQDAPSMDDGYLHRLVLRETDIDALQNVGATYLIDAWYLVRDDVNIFNSMGFRSLQPQFAGGLWTPGTLGTFRGGSVIDQWLELAPEASETRRSEATSVEGHTGLATQVTHLPDGRWRYDYALMNFDFARAVTDSATAEPNLRILSSGGFSALELDLANGATVDASEFRDGDAAALNDWTASATATALRLTAPGAYTLDWGQLVFVRVISTAAPASGEMRLDVALSGSPAFYTLSTLVPDGAQVFRNGFE